MIGSANLGASQRLRVNFIPLAVLFPIILEKNSEIELILFNFRISKFFVYKFSH